MKFTKKMFEEHLNRIHGIIQDSVYNKQGSASNRSNPSARIKRPYGTYFRKADAEYFNMEFKEWVAEQSSTERAK